jgi:hypothetical protein
MGIRVSLRSPYMHSWVGVQILKLSDGIFGEYVLLRYPLVFSVWIPLPLNEVLQLAPSSETPLGHYLLHFILFFPIDKGQAEVYCSLHRGTLSRDKGSGGPHETRGVTSTALGDGVRR